MSSVIAWMIPAIGVRPPFLIFVAVRAIAPVAGMPPKRGLAMFAIPCAISSVFESCFVPIIPSATTAESSDSIAASTAIEIAVGKRVVIVLRLRAGSVGIGSVFGITKCCEPSAKVPIVSVRRPVVFSRMILTAVARMITTKLPGIFLINLDQMKMKARQTAAMIVE